MYILHWLFIGCQYGHISPLSTEQFGQLHKKVYEVYQIPLEQELIHDLLSEVFVGEALTKEYVEHFTSRVHMQNDDTSIDIRQINYNSITVIAQYPQSIVYDVDWSVGGVVTHQKHKHPRVNRYRAIFTLQPHHTEWRIGDTKMRNAERIQRAGVSDADFFDGKSSAGGYLDPLDLIDAGVIDEESD